jgi:hypothetical protein
MGKRELLLILGFIAVGAVVYQVSAPPADPSRPGFSFSGLLAHIQTVMKGEEIQAPIVLTAVVESRAGGGVPLSLKDYRGVLRVVAEDREDISAELRATAFGLDEAAARARAQQIALTLDEQADGIVVKLTQPKEGRRARFELTLHIPEEQAMELGLRSGEAELRGVSRVALLDGRGKITILDATHITGSFQGDLTVQQVDSVKVSVSRGDVRFDEVRGPLEIEAERADLTLNKLSGPVTLKIKHLTCKMEDVDGPVKITSDHGHVELRDARAPLIVEATESEVIVMLAHPVETTITNTDGAIDVRVPKGGVKIDAATKDGAIRTTWNGPAFSSTERSQTFIAAQEHGGPLIKLRNEGGDIFIR